MRSTSFGALGTTAVVAVAAESALQAARTALALDLEQLDETCSRFRADSELSRANACAGTVVRVSPLLAELLGVALAAAVATDGRVDPTLGSELRAAGYDRTFALLRDRGRWMPAPPRRRGAPWRAIRLDPVRLTLHAPAGVELDLGATAKAWAADRSARAIADTTGSGVLVSLGGDVAAAGTPPPGGWPIRIADDHAAPADASDPVVSIATGGVATSSTTVRRWRTDRGDAHHLLDPQTGTPLSSCWRTVSVAASTCVDANVASTAAIVLSEAAPAWLEARGLPARLVGGDGTVVATGGWPAERAAA